MIDFEALVDNLGGLVVVCDEDGLVIWVNDAARDFLGPDFEDLVEHPLDTWLRGTDGFLWPALGEESKERVLMYEANGRSERMRGDIRPIAVQGQMGWVAQLRLAAGQAERLEGLQALSGTIASQLAEQLKTVITSATEALLKQPAEPQAEAFRQILDAAQGAALLQKQLAGLGGDADLRRTSLSLGSLVHDSERALQNALGRKYSLVIEGCEAGVGLIEGDPHALGIVLVELAEWVANYHGGQSGGLRISLDTNSDETVRLQLTDDGRGLTATQRAALHDPTGPGLGLAIAFGVVSQHGGRILVDSVLGRGTTFHLEFPVEGGGPEPTVTRRGTETILVVEDEEVIRRWVQVTLESLGYTVITARNGVDAAAVLREKRDECDLLIIDAVLPGISGLELIAETLAADPTKRVLLMTGYSADLVGSEVLDHVPLLEKPFTPAELVDFVNQLLDD